MAHALTREYFLEPPSGRWALGAALAVSFVLHLMLVYLTPPLGEAALPAVVYTEVELLRMPEAPPKVQRTPPPAPSAERAEPKMVWKAVEGETAASLERQAVEALRRARTKSLGSTMEYPGLALSLPAAPAAEPTRRAEAPEEVLVQESLARTGQAVAMPGVPEGKELLALPGEAGERKPFSVASETSSRLADDLLEAELARRPAPRPPTAEVGIKGPAALRQVLFRPATPSVTVERETAVLLKFWVRNDGTVGRVVPLRKGDPRLEAVAVGFLKGWRFNSIDVGVEEQWGTINIVFRLP